MLLFTREFRSESVACVCRLAASLQGGGTTTWWDSLLVKTSLRWEFPSVRACILFNQSTCSRCISYRQRHTRCLTAWRQASSVSWPSWRPRLRRPLVPPPPSPQTQSSLLHNPTATPPRRNKTDVLVTSIGPNLLPHRMRLCSALWAVNIKAEFPYE
jgi:hypothetical protein